MDKTMKKLLWGLVGLILLLILLDATAEQPVDWSASYVHTENKAMATEVFYKGLETVTTTIEHQVKPPFKVFKDSLPSGTYVFINQSVGLTDEESEQLLDWVSAGNTGFIASYGVPKLLLDTLGLDVSYYISNSEIEYQPSFRLKNKSLQQNEFKTSRKAFEYLYFSEIDTAKTQTLGLVKTAKTDKAIHTNYVEVEWGKGSFLFHLAPQVYTNYFMVDGSNGEYTSKTLGYLDLNQPLYWDDYYKAGKERVSNPLYYLLSNPYLKSAYYLIIIASLFYVLFGGKRKQRPIPVIEPVKNRSYEFTQTIAGMYLDKKDHKAIAQKQINSFFEHIRSTYQLQTHSIDQEFIQNLAFKTGTTAQELNALFEYIQRLNTTENITEDDLKTLDKKLTTFNR